MKKKFSKILIPIIAVAIFLILPKAAKAASLSFSLDSKQIYAGDVFVVQLNLESLKEKVNVAEASVHFDSSILEVQDISTGGSIFSMWTRAPIYNNQTGQIMFTGGTTGSFSGSEGDVLKIIFVAKQKGDASLDFAVDSALYLADGKGTKISPHFNNGLVSVLGRPQNYNSTNPWDSLLAGDKTPPKNLIVVLGKDPSVFDNKYFISFSATDSESGISYYAVKEGQSDFVQTESPYVLKDQTLASKVSVKAVDKAGNVTTANANLSLQGGGTNYIIWIIIAVIILILGLAWKFKIRRNQKK